MEPTPIAASPLSQEDLASLRRAKEALESPSLTMKLASLVGSPIEKLMAKMPTVAQEKIDDATQAALKKCLQLALRTLSKSTVDGVVLPPEKPHNLMHKLAVATTGAAGGAFGLFALPVELPVTTTLMFRSICDIARSEGEDVHLIETQLQCLMVLGMGGPSSSDDNADIGSIAVMFTDLKGSTELYEALGDVTAYNLVRDHFDFLLERVQRNHGFLVKTAGDAVMAAFSRPDDAVRAALAIQDDIASFNAARGGSMNATPIVLKLGIHAGSCIAVTTGDTLDYFGATVNIAARLANECRGGEVIVSEAVAKDAETGAALANRMRREETAALRGVSEPVRFVRVKGFRDRLIDAEAERNQASVSSPITEV